MKSIPSFNLRRVIYILTSAVLLTGVVTAASMQPAARIQVADPRPLAAVIAELEKRHGRVVTYEDPTRVHPSDIADITATVPRERRKGQVLVPKGGAFTFSYDPPKDESDSSIASMLNSLVEQYNRASADAQFRVTRTREVFHVLPATTKMLNGTLQTSVSPLDTMITIPEEQRTGLEQLEAISEALRASGHRRFGVGIVPFAAFKRTLNGGVSNEPARDALVRVLDSSPYKVSYALYCDAGPNPTCMLNLHAIPLRTQ